MISFRYHLVSTVAVLLALAVGIVVGTTVLGGPVLDDLDRRVSDLSDDKRALEADLEAAGRRSAAEDEAARLLAPGLVSGRLTGQRVVLVSTPDAPVRLREELVPLLTKAGATVGASVRLRPALLDPANRQLLSDLVATAAVPGQDLPDGEPLEQAASQLSQVLVRRAGSEPAAGTARRVLSAYAGEDLLDVEGSPDAPGTLAVLLTGPAPQGEDAEAQTRALLGLARTLDVSSSGAVVAGPPASATGEGLLAAVREDGATSDRVSSVDAADTAVGRLAVVLALQEQQTGGSGSYGSAAGVDGPLPTPPGR
ncbi:MAG: hypothetical protein JWO60_57 [Frankiales bacterium]|nr:hypothetical protein [Frankiales bacterium]